MVNQQAIAPNNNNQLPEGPLVRPAGYRIIPWLAKYILFPLTPFIVGSTIRIIQSNDVTFRVFDTEELSFSLAVLCLLTILASERLDNADYKFTIFALFSVGLFLFTSFYIVSVSESFRLEGLNASVIINFEKIADKSAAITNNISDLVLSTQRNDSQRILDKLFWYTLPTGLLFITAGVYFRRIYGLGDE